MIFIPGSPVLVPDDGEDDDISILEVNDSRCFNITFSLLKTQMDGFSSSFFSFLFLPSHGFQKSVELHKNPLFVIFCCPFIVCHTFSIRDTSGLQPGPWSLSTEPHYCNLSLNAYNKVVRSSFFNYARHLPRWWRWHTFSTSCLSSGSPCFHECYININCGHWSFAIKYFYNNNGLFLVQHKV